MHTYCVEIYRTQRQLLSRSSVRAVILSLLFVPFQNCSCDACGTTTGSGSLSAHFHAQPMNAIVTQQVLRFDRCPAQTVVSLMQMTGCTCGLMSVLLDLTEGVHNDSQQEVEQNHEHQKLKGPEEEGCRHALQALQLVQVVIHADVAQQDGEAGVDCCAKRGELLQQDTLCKQLQHCCCANCATYPVQQHSLNACTRAPGTSDETLLQCSAPCLNWTPGRHLKRHGTFLCLRKGQRNSIADSPCSMQ